VPLKATTVKGEYVCGIRYRAWQPPSALHPTIGVDTPLVLDIVDTWNGRSIGGCTYHVSHPGGRNYDTFPVNSYEAESRRVSRFWEMGFTPDVLMAEPLAATTGHRVVPGRAPYTVPDPPPVEINPEYPTTLDMRKFKARKRSQ
jgi:uncharacterized protein (DUF2126 family)